MRSVWDRDEPLRKGASFPTFQRISSTISYVLLTPTPHPLRKSDYGRGDAYGRTMGASPNRNAPLS
jgi:hypothetical protein